MDATNSICPYCKASVQPIDIFCPACGKKLIGEDSSSVKGQISAYLISFFLPPFGLIPAVKYIRQKDPKSRKIGFMCIALTVLSILLSLIAARSVLSSFESQLQMYEGIGY